MRVKLLSPAKINQTLKILAYNKFEKKHQLRSKVNILKLADEITISNSKKLTINYYYNKKKIIIQNDIIYKTIKFFDQKYFKSSNFKIKIKKIFPLDMVLAEALQMQLQF